MKRWTAVLAGLLLISLPAPLAAEEPGDVVRFGENISLEAEETAVDVVCFGCDVVLRGRATGDVVVFGGSIEVTGTVEGDVVGFGGPVRLEAPARVGGDVVAFGGELQRDPQAEVGGTIHAEGLPFRSLSGLLVGLFLFFAVVHLILVLVAYLIAGRERVETVGGVVETSTGWALLAGVGVTVAALVLYVIAGLLGPVSFLLAVLVTLALLVTLVMGYTGVSWLLGRALVRQKGGPLAKIFVGAVLITLLQAVPLLGLLVFLVAGLLALGSAVFSGYGTASDWLPRAFAGGFRPPPTPPPPPES